MARNIPECQWIFNSSSGFPFPNETADGSCTVNINESCSDCFFWELTDPFVYSLIVCYSLIMTIGYLGNISVIAIILSTRQLRIPINLLLVALAFSDLIITVAMPFSFLGNISYEYRKSVGICKGTIMLQGTAVMSGIYTLVVLALERFYVIVRPFQNRILDSPKRIAICIGVIWIISACLQIPLAIVLDVETFPLYISYPSFEVVEVCQGLCGNTSLRFCFETWSTQSALAFSYVVLIVMYILPLLCISCLYFRIARAMAKRKPVGSASSKEVKLYEQKRRLITFLTTLVVTFAVLWGPYFTIHCVRTPIVNDYLFSYLQMLGHMNVAVNPILYAYFHRKVRQQACFYIRRASGILVGSKHQSDDSGVNSVSAMKKPTTSDAKEDRPLNIAPTPRTDISVTKMKFGRGAELEITSVNGEAREENPDIPMVEIGNESSSGIFHSVTDQDREKNSSTL